MEIHNKEPTLVGDLGMLQTGGQESFVKLVTHPLIASLCCLIIYAIWTHRFSKAWQQHPDATINNERIKTAIHKLGTTSTIAFVFQFLMLYLIVDANMQAEAAWILIFVLQAIQGDKVRDRIRGIQISTRERLSLFFRPFFAMILYFTVYLLFYFLVMALFLVLYKMLKQLGVSSPYIFVFSLLYVAIALISMWIFPGMFSPLIIRMMFPTKPLADEAFALPLQESLDALPGSKPQVRIIEMDKYKLYNALVSGNRWGRDPFRLTIFLSRGLLSHLTEKELLSVVHHELGHIAHNHLLKRQLISFIAILGVGFLDKLLAKIFFGNLDGRLATPFHALNFLFVLGTALFLFRRLVRFQEIEADSYAVFQLNSSIEDFASALTKITEMNHLEVKKNNWSTYLNISAAHPTIEERINLLKAQQDQKLGNSMSLFQTQWHADMWNDKSKHVFSVILVLGFLFYGFATFLAISPPNAWLAAKTTSKHSRRPSSE